jgi:hypothetical protein
MQSLGTGNAVHLVGACDLGMQASGMAAWALPDLSPTLTDTELVEAGFA